MRSSVLTTSLSDIKGIGPLFAERLEKLHLHTVKDLLYYFPFRYQDFSNIKPISNLILNEVATIHGTIEKISVSKTFHRKLLIITVRVSDETGSIEAIWFNQRFLLTQLKEGLSINIAGTVTQQGKKMQFNTPEFEIISRDSYVPRHTGRLVPIYSETKGITSKGIRFVVEKILPLIASLEECLPQYIIEQYSFPPLAKALMQIHHPQSIQEAERAQERFAFQDLFLLQLLKSKEKYHITKKPAHAFPYTPEQIKTYFSYIPFELTLGQKKALHDILEDLTQPHATHRLLQGDVGSGKTVVAAIAALVVASHQKQAIFMAPTEVLAQQHYRTFTSFFEEFSHGVALLTSSHTTVFFGKGLEREISKKELLTYIKSGKIKIIIGTHSVIQKSVSFDEVGLLVIDEQHRFGVNQRAELLTRTQTYNPHLLSMSATPIPRTLALTVFGDLDFSIINELPKNRKPIDTRIVPAPHRQKAYEFIHQQVEAGRQVYVVCPRIASVDPDQKLTPRQLLQLDVKNVEEEYKKLSKVIFKDLCVGMLHGQMKSDEKQKIMSTFKKGGIDILVSTSVIEVGVDVPNATIMMIEGSEHFGLSQLYQFRGRVGRGVYQSYCFLFTDSKSKITLARLKALISAKNGFELAEMDLKFRGPGQFLGTEQTGIPDLAMKALRNPTMVKDVYESVQSLLKQDSELKKYPYLTEYLKLFEQKIHLE
ncbi:MAG: ATP-dependent DNA helicase RecG [Candidatus Paceibacterota bacterium]